jgi:hypothetical protein
MTASVIVLVAVPLFVTTVNFPDFARAGTVALMAFAENTLNGAFTPAIVTEVAFFRFVPAIMTFVPTLALVGKTPVIVGRAAWVAPRAEPAARAAAAAKVVRPRAMEPLVRRMHLLLRSL